MPQGNDVAPISAWREEITTRVAAVVRRSAPEVPRVLEVGCGPGWLLDQLVEPLGPRATLTGVESDPAVMAVARARAAGRFDVQQGTAEALPVPDASLDVVVASLSFDHWADQQAGIGECARVLTPGGSLIIADLMAGWMIFGAALRRHRRKARSPRVVIAMCLRAELQPVTLQQIQRVGPLPLVQALVSQR